MGYEHLLTPLDLTLDMVPKYSSHIIRCSYSECYPSYEVILYLNKLFN